MKKILLVLSAVVLLASCKKEITQLPPATQTGANTLGMMIDGALWGPAAYGSVPTAPILEARLGSDGSVFINARNFASTPTETELELHLQPVTGPGTILLNRNTAKYPAHTGSYAYFIKRKLMPLGEWITTSQYTGSVEVTKFNLSERIISGTFSFRAVSTDNSAAPLEVTEGRFDVKFQ